MKLSFDFEIEHGNNICSGNGSGRIRSLLILGGHTYFINFYFYFRATLSGAQSLLLNLYSKIIPGDVPGTI